MNYNFIWGVLFSLLSFNIQAIDFLNESFDLRWAVKKKINLGKKLGCAQNLNGVFYVDGVVNNIGIDFDEDFNADVYLYITQLKLVYSGEQQLAPFCFNRGISGELLLKSPFVKLKLTQTDEGPYLSVDQVEIGKIEINDVIAEVFNGLVVEVDPPEWVNYLISGGVNGVIGSLLDSKYGDKLNEFINTKALDFVQSYSPSFD